MSQFLNFAGNQGTTFKNHGTGGGTSFTLDLQATTNSVLLAVGGVLQEPGVDYTVLGTTITTTTSVTAGIEVFSWILHRQGTAPVIQDNSVTGGKIALTSQAEGDLMYCNASGDWVRLAKGTAGQVLTQNSGLTAPEWAAASSDVVLLATNTPSAASTSDLTAFDNATYNNYLVIGSLTQSSDGQTVGFRVSTDGGSTYRSTTSSYNFGGSKVDDNGSEGLFNATTQTFVHIATSAGAAAGESIGFSLWLYDVADTALKTTFSFTASSFSTDATPRGTGIHGGGSARFTEDVDAIQFLTSSGTISGNLKLYGLK